MGPHLGVPHNFLPHLLLLGPTRSKSLLISTLKRLLNYFSYSKSQFCYPGAPVGIKNQFFVQGRLFSEEPFKSHAHTTSNFFCSYFSTYKKKEESSMFGNKKAATINQSKMAVKTKSGALFTYINIIFNTRFTTL